MRYNRYKYNRIFYYKKNIIYIQYGMWKHHNAYEHTVSIKIIFLI